MCLMYSLTTIPFCIIWVIDANQEMSEYYLLYSWLFFKLCSAATPVVYSLFYSSISQSYKFFIYRFILHKQMKPSDDEAPIKKKKEKNLKCHSVFLELNLPKAARLTKDDFCRVSLDSPLIFSLFADKTTKKKENNYI